MFAKMRLNVFFYIEVLYKPKRQASETEYKVKIQPTEIKVKTGAVSWYSRQLERLNNMPGGSFRVLYPRAMEVNCSSNKFFTKNTKTLEL